MSTENVSASKILERCLRTSLSARQAYENAPNLFVCTAAKQVWLVSEARAELAGLYVSRTTKGHRA